MTPTGTSSGATALNQIPALQTPGPFLGPQIVNAARSTHSPTSLAPLTVIPPPFPPITNHQRSSVAAPPSPVKLTPISQDAPVTILSSMSLTVATFTSSQARPSPSVIPRPEPVAQKATSTGASLTSSNTLTAGGIPSSPPSTTLPSSTRSSGLYARDSQTGNRTSVADSAIVTSKVQAPSPGQRQPESEAAPVKGTKSNWFQKIRKYFWE